MSNRNRFARPVGLCLTSAVLLTLPTVGKAHPSPDEHNTKPLIIDRQGAYSYGGKVLGDSSLGASVHCDHGYVEYQIPRRPRALPLLLHHSASTKTWETTFAGEQSDGFKNIFLRRGFPIYMIDAPRVGRAGQGCRAWSYTPPTTSFGGVGMDHAQFVNYRLGTWTGTNRQFFPNVQFPTDNPDALDQAYRALYPEFDDPEAVRVETNEIDKLLDGWKFRKGIGPVVLINHSGSGSRGWYLRIKSENVKAIVAYEPGSFVWPEGMAPARQPMSNGVLIDPGKEVPMSDFIKLTKIPIQVVWGDNIPAHPHPETGIDHWRVRLAYSRQFVDMLNAHGGDAKLLHLPEIGIRGNTHFVMADLNSRTIAGLLSKFLKEKGLDGFAHKGNPKEAGHLEDRD